MHFPGEPASATEGAVLAKRPARSRGSRRRVASGGALAALLVLAALGEERVQHPAFFGDPHTREPPPKRPWPRTSPPWPRKSPGDSPSAWAWEVLEVEPGTAKEDLHLAYLQKAKEEHPDRRPGDKGAAERFIRINAAYKELVEGPASSQATQPRRPPAASRQRQGGTSAAATPAAGSEAADDDASSVYLSGVASSLVVVVYFGLFESSERVPLAAYILSIWLAVLVLMPRRMLT